MFTVAAIGGAINLSANMSAQFARALFRRQLLAGSKRRAGVVEREQYRCFSCSVRQAQQQHTPPPKSTQDGPGTTHFGFQTVAEALKEQKGMLITISIALDCR